MRILVIVLVSLILSACGTTISRDPVSIRELEAPQVPGIKNARFWADDTPPNINELLTERQQQARAAGLPDRHADLTLSGGAENGAYAAGILTAWSESGTRPVFMNVTGVSTGALAAPFAFLGSDYDDELKRLYGGLPPEQIFERRPITQIFSKASVKSSGPLRRLLEDYVTDEFLEKIAVQHRRGRRLVIQTVSLDAQRPVLWDLGRIAASGAPNARKVFQDALMASAAMPGVFPPVLIDVETPFGIRDELHVDGGVVSQSMFVPGWRIPSRFTEGTTLYAIRNGKIDPEAEITKPGIADISKRSLATLIKYQGAVDLGVAYAIGQRQGVRYNATWIGPDFNAPLNEPFDPEYMQALFDYGYMRFKSGTVWNRKPPG
ncbi:patatin-like phospholipase family protein [Ruegeria sp. B32]|uniref:patatin-like phospholipase family protein n=1 Tax=Ruegeria sp. B32 TaxID=2867020 RepID=UPI0021A30F7E|nr:patatin-like phospholipase family protein [Ruegeria sp. B32]UWR08359.1 patatin-like phospholipase family protein [Ruegeria sp. B32]